MGEKRKIPVTAREFLWVQEDDRGQIVLHVGPTMVSFRAGERMVVSNKEGEMVSPKPFCPQKMIEVSDHQYAILYEPLKDLQSDEKPNGNVRTGRNETRPLDYGRKSVIPGPASFYLRPGQRMELRDAYELASNEYILARVYGEVDESSPHYLTTKKAAIREGNDGPLTRGQLIAIRGLDTFFYIPPSGVEILPDTSKEIHEEVPLEARERSPKGPSMPPFPPPTLAAVATRSSAALRPAVIPSEPSAPHRGRSGWGKALEKEALQTLPLLSPPSVDFGGLSDAFISSQDYEIRDEAPAKTFAKNDNISAVSFVGEKNLIEDGWSMPEEALFGSNIGGSDADPWAGDEVVAFAELSPKGEELERSFDELNEEDVERSDPWRDSDLFGDEEEEEDEDEDPSPVAVGGFGGGGASAGARMDSMEMEPSPQYNMDFMEMERGPQRNIARPSGGKDFSSRARKARREEKKKVKRGKSNDALRRSLGVPPPAPQGAPQSSPLMGSAPPDPFGMEEMEEMQQMQPSFPGGAPPLQAPSPMVQMAASQVPKPKPRRSRIAQAQVESLSDGDIESMLSGNIQRRELERRTRLGEFIRKALLLNEKEYCIVIDADGKQHIKIGPARIFPGPYERFMSQRSRRGIYDAFELLPDKGLWIRLIKAMSTKHLAEHLPNKVVLDQDTYHAGDDLILSGVNTFFFPFDGVEILDPSSGQPRIGNHHQDAFISAIGIHQLSGIYLRNLTSGEVRLVRGQASILVDPRREVRVTRTLSPREWRLWISATQPQRQSTGAVTTPWAISVIVPLNSAIMVISGHSRRVVEGPCVERLAYDEQLIALQAPAESGVEETCFIKVRDEAFNECLSAETSDYAKVDIELKVHTAFDPSMRTHWFDVPDCFEILREQVRSRIRMVCQKFTFFDLWRDISKIVDETLVSKGTLSTTGIESVNGLRVVGVEFLSIRAADPSVAKLMHNSKRDLVLRELETRLDRERFTSEQLHHEINVHRLDLQCQLQESIATLALAIENLEQAERSEMLQQDAARMGEKQRVNEELQSVLSRTQVKHEVVLFEDTLEITRLKKEAKTRALKDIHQEQRKYQRVLEELANTLFTAQSESENAKRRALQPKLLQAINSLGKEHGIRQIATTLSDFKLMPLDLGAELLKLLSDHI